MSVVDLRSDTVTRPTSGMREAMARAEVGDDVYREDPTVRRLEERTAELLGKEAALFVPSGTMSNQIALSLLAGPGSEVVIDENCHVLNFEAGSAAAFWGITLRSVPGDRGRLDPRKLLAQVRPRDEHVAPVRAVSIENTHNRAGGAVWSRESLDAIFAAAVSAEIPVHVDGARLWNAAAALAANPAELVSGSDTVSVCFSKGLGAPVGSAIVSTGDRIEEARFRRKRLGGGMRQAGIVAAGALYALEHHRERLVEDHGRAGRLGEALAELPGIRVLPVESNIVIADLTGSATEPDGVVRALAERGVLVGNIQLGRIRMVTHLDVDDAGLDRAIEAFAGILGNGA